MRLSHLFFLRVDVRTTVGQAIGSSALRFAEQSCVNPQALIYFIAILLSELSEPGRRKIDSAATIKRAVGNAIAAGGETCDLGGTIDIRTVGATIAAPIDAL